MGEATKISWADATWNPWRGCKMVSPGCANCYMFRDQRRYGLDPEQVVRTKPNIWNLPYRLQRRAVAEGLRIMVFTCSWSDFFIEQADPWRAEAWKIIRDTPEIIYQVLTKRPHLIADRLPPDWGDGYPNVGLGVSIETARYVHRADVLRGIPAAVRFISAEPLLGRIDGLNLDGFHWLIAGGESGPDFRPMDAAWAFDLLEKCRTAGVAFHYKQGSGTLPGQDTLLGGVEYHEFPDAWMKKTA